MECSFLRLVCQFTILGQPVSIGAEPLRRIVFLLIAAVSLVCVATAAIRAKQGNARRVVSEQRKFVSPTRSNDAGYVSSDACKACHPGEYDSWHRTYHRTMTQVASPESVMGDFDNVTLEYFGKKFHLQTIDDAYWITEQGGRSAKVLQTTGSHHYQVYWVSGGKGNMLHNFPFVYLLEEQRWVRRNDVFMMPPSIGNQPESVRAWNDGCIACHATHGQAVVNVDANHANTKIAELGIACEACHGPAAEHIAHYSNPLTRYKEHLSESTPTAIVNPERCDSKTSTQVCGQCHGVTREDDREAWSRRGYAYRPGDELEDSRIVARHPANVSQPWHGSMGQDFFDSYFWKDGMVRVSGREYNGLLETPCYQNGELSCLSCHSMHESDPNDQMKAGMLGNTACLQCHDEIEKNVSAHTHHDEGSSGSECYNCHMPHTTYGLLKAIRSHEISSPNVATTLKSGRPQACNLCHLDKTLEWTSDHLADWYDQPKLELTTEQKTVSAALLDLLKGDAGQRAIAAWHMGWAPAQEASQRDWLGAALPQLLDDPYAVVRYIAYQSMKTLDEFSDFEYDFVVESQKAKRDEAVQRWQDAELQSTPNTETLIDEMGRLESEKVEALQLQRDRRPVDLLE